MIFIKPTIIRDAETMSRISSEKYRMMRELQLERDDDGIALMPFTDSPVMREEKLPKKLQQYLDEHYKKQAQKQSQDD